MIFVTLDRHLRNLQKRFTFRRALLGLIAFLFLFAKIILLFNKCDEDEKEKPKEQTTPKYVLHGDRVDSGYLKHVMAVLQRLGFERVYNSTEFDLLWSHVYPFGALSPFPEPFFRNLKPQQKVRIHRGANSPSPPPHAHS